MTLLFVSSKHEKNRWSYFFKNGLICIGILSTMVILLYWPIWEGWATITNPMAYHSTKTPSRSYTEIFILVYRYGSEILANGTTIPELMKLAQSPDFFPISEVISLKNKIAPFFAGLGLLLAILNLLPVLAVKKTNDVYYYFAKLWIIIIVIYSPIFNPWYFMPIILLMIYHRKKSWIFFLIFITSISMNYQIGNSIPLDSLLNLLVTINMVLMLIMFLYKFKLHFIKEPLQEIRGMYRSILVAN
jgi:hypothetical protein